ncbi:hypothetical protein NQ318_016843 [Aromia moschata]|uniref:Uncharacterized protein n=1 Tax=Aromia moschata TaxID=1265417 RepID=A0AAV8YSF1_9CUCU|nr:hypothetical protein NQ318_016843 [Aromia moschata]
MENGNIEVDYSCSRLPHESDPEMISNRNQYGLPENYNPAEHPPVKLRSHTSSDQSETQRKRRSKNRLSNRRSTGYVPPEVVDEALKLGSDVKEQGNERK